MIAVGSRIRRFAVLVASLLVLTASVSLLAYRVQRGLDRGWAGFAFQSATPQELEEMVFPVSLGGGSRTVIAVAAFSPAEAAGVRVGDRVRSINGVDVEDFGGLLARAHAMRPGDTLVYQFEREGRPREVRLSWCNAGHVPPLLMRTDGRLEWPAEGGPAIARVLADGAYQSGDAALAVGDVVALFTDGVVEAVDPSGELFGEDRVVSTVRGQRDLTAAELARVLAVAARRHAAGDAQDDVTVVVARIV